MIKRGHAVRVSAAAGPSRSAPEEERADRLSRTAYGHPYRSLSKESERERKEGEYRGKLGEEGGVTMRASALQVRKR